MEKKISYEKALEELQGIVSSLENEQMGMDELGENVTRATHLLKLCQERLRQTESTIKDALSN